MVELVLWHVGCRECGWGFTPLLTVLGLSGTRRTDRLTVDLARLATQVSFARPLGCPDSWPVSPPRPGRRTMHWPIPPRCCRGRWRPGPGHPSPEVVMLDGTGARAGANKNGVGLHLALG